MAKTLALFDFDGTLTTKDTMIEFIRFCRGDLRYFGGMVALSPWLVAMKAGFFPNDKAKEKLLRMHFGGWSREQLFAKGEEFAQKIVPGLMRKTGLDMVKSLQQEGAEILLVSASLDFWTKPYFEQQGWSSLTTEGEFKGEKFTGKLGSPNCYGPEKVERIEQVKTLKDYDRILAFGDSNGDREMLALAQEPHFKPFR